MGTAAFTAPSPALPVTPFFPTSSPLPTPTPDPIETLLLSLTLEEKIGQLFFIRPESIVADSPDGVLTVSSSMHEAYSGYPAGGFVLFRKNLKDPEQLVSLTEDLHRLGKIRPLVCIDEEGGKIARIANHKAFPVPKVPEMGSIGNTGDIQKARDAGSTIGEYLSRYGVDLDFAPVADVNTNPRNPVIGSRAFGKDPELVGRMVSAYLDGLHAHGIFGCLKHFPGHGDTRTDSHSGYAETEKSWEELLSCEILPFKAGMQAGPEMIMVAHIAAPQVTGTKEPATLSPTLVTQKLRLELGYEGIIITDSMEMKAVSQSYSSGEAAVLALKAGVDIVLMPADYREAFTAVLRAVTDGELSEERIDESVRRILRLKKEVH
ncbi:MAG: glycoside hydrolase [Clostridia bacterium]|nr:glycoside hydrolase [Clostridia bacterium]